MCVELDFSMLLCFVTIDFYFNELITYVRMKDLPLLLRINFVEELISDGSMLNHQPRISPLYLVN